jgi:tetratricopeptide (TPR) repeat protein
MLFTAFATASLMFAQQAAPAASAIDEPARLAACIAEIETDPEAAYETALTWTYQGNRPAARYCYALTLLANDRPDDGALKLEQLANARDGGTLEERAIYLSQAGHGWLQAGAPDAAIVAFSNALKLDKDDAALLTDRAGAYVLAEQSDTAMSDLDAALKALPGFGPAHQMRAQLNLDAGKLDAALADVKAAMAADPENIDTLVLRGAVREAIRVKTSATPSQ